MFSLLIEERNKQVGMSYPKEIEEFILSILKSDRDEIAATTLKMDNFKSWFNSARFLNMRPPINWEIMRLVGTEKIDLKFVAEVDEDNALIVTICNMSDYDVCFEGTMKAKITMETSNIAERVWHALGRRRVKIFVINPTESEYISNIVIGHHHIHKADQTLSIFGRDGKRRYLGGDHGQWRFAQRVQDSVQDMHRPRRSPRHTVN